MGNKSTKPSGWWITHPTVLMASVHGCFDSNNDGLGDFEGIRQKLDYFLEMGISGYRFQHIGDYGDDYEWDGLVLQDWFNVDKHYGTMDDFERLMEDCRAKDIAIMMMAIPEYIGWHHPDYLAAKVAKEKGADDPRVQWFDWNDDGTVLTCWNRPGPIVSNPEYLDAYLKHIGFWMDKGVAGWDADAVGAWHKLDLDTLRKFNEYIKKRGGLVTAENMVLERDVTKYGGFNAGTGYLRHQFYNELDAIMQHKADFIREALKVREELISLGMFPYQQFGEQTYTTLKNSWFSRTLEMFKLQVAFNAVLPDQVWILANAVTFTEGSWGKVDWDEIESQEKNYDSPYSHVRRMFALRAQNKELAIGDIEELKTNHPEDVFAAIRTSEDGEERALVVFNFSEETKDVVIYFKDNSIKKLRNYLSGEILEQESISLKVKINLYGYKFFKIICC